MGLYKHIYTASKIAPITYNKLNPPSLTKVRIFNKYLGFTSHYTTLPSVEISDCPKRLLRLGFDQKLHNPLSHFVGTRHYSVDRFQDYVCWPVIKCLSFVTFLIGRFEIVPFTNKIVYVFPFIDKIWGELYYSRCVTEGYKKGEVLSQDHPLCVRVESIAVKLLEALRRESGRNHVLADQQWLVQDDGEVKLVKICRRKEIDESVKVRLKEGIDWEFFVLDVPMACSGYINIGKILVFTGMFDRYKTDAELAIIIAHEVGHVVSRHAQRRLTWFPFKLYHRFINGYDPEISYYLWHEQEADYIALLLSASAGYDPRVALLALRKMKRDLKKLKGSEVPLLHLKERIEFVSKPEVMQKAVSVYQERMGGQCTEY